MSAGRRRVAAVAALGASVAAAAYMRSRASARAAVKEQRAEKTAALAAAAAATATATADTGKAAVDAKGRPKRAKVAVDREFVRRLRKLLRIVLPGLWSKEGGLVVAHSAFLALRTFITIYVSRLDGAIVKAIVDRRAQVFFFRLLRWLAVAVPATYCNSMLRYLEGKIAMAFRTRLTEHSYALYMRNETYYRVLSVDSRMENPDQCLVEDVDKFTSHLSHLYSQMAKPIFDLLLISYQLFSLARRRTGESGGLKIHLPWMIGTVVVAGTFSLLRWATPPFGRMVAKEGELYGNLRAVHARLITHSEEVAMYTGEKIEESALRRAYSALVKHKNLIMRVRVPFTVLEQFLLKYVWSSAGLCMIAIPALLQQTDADAAAVATTAAAATGTGDADGGVSLLHDRDLSSDGTGDESISRRTQDFVTAKSMLVSVADAFERLMSSFKDVQELAGYTARVYDMLHVFGEVSAGRFVKASSDAGADMLGRAGEVVEGADEVRFEHVPIVTPAGDVLVRDMSISIARGQHVLISGPNGCGKSSLFRIASGLWPVRGGRLSRPARGEIFKVPQRPYLCEGTLRSQFIYPDTEDDMRARGVTDDDLARMLATVDLAYVVEREGGWDAVSEWRDVLSGGEKQRVGFARVFYHRPKFAILDECTSQVSIDTEGAMYMHAKALGVTLISVSHRPTLAKHHDWLLQFDGEGGYTYTELDATARVSMEEERTRLAKTLSDVPRLQERYAELCGILGHKS